MDKEEFNIIANTYAKKSVAKIFPENIEKIRNAICVSCGSKIKGFKSELCKREYQISGLCQKCQDSVFGVE